MDVYEELRKRLDTHPTGCPEAPEILEILAGLYTQEEARVAAVCAFRPKPAEWVAERAGISPVEAKELLESMANKGLMYAREKNGEWGYALMPIIPGIFEIPYMHGTKDENLERLAGLWDSYLKRVMARMSDVEVAHARVVPIQEEVESRAEVLPYEKVYDMIDKARVVGLVHCACRTAFANCDAPLEACMAFDDACNYLVDRGFARYITKDEMKQKLREFDEAGLVHNVNNTGDRLQFICNCCSCCCGFLRSVNELEHPNFLATSGYISSVGEDLCNACAVCEDRCPVGAIEVADEVAVVDTGRCIGCALCVTGCDVGAVGLVRREELPVTPGNLVEFGKILLDSRGKLEEFVEINK